VRRHYIDATAGQRSSGNQQVCMHPDNISRSAIRAVIIYQRDGRSLLIAGMPQFTVSPRSFSDLSAAIKLPYQALKKERVLTSVRFSYSAIRAGPSKSISFVTRWFCDVVILKLEINPRCEDTSRRLKSRYTARADEQNKNQAPSTHFKRGSIGWWQR
jgi:hypothetical protein